MKKTLKNYLVLFYTMFKIGLFTFGGGYAMIALIERELVRNKKWIDEDEMFEMITIAESTPGPIAVNIATYVGYKLLKTLGSILATLGVVLPAFTIIVTISIFLEKFMAFEIVQKAFLGINCGVGILILSAGINLMKTMEKGVQSILLLIFTFLGTLAVLFFGINVSTVVFLIIGALVAIVVNSIKTRNKKEEAEC